MQSSIQSTIAQVLFDQTSTLNFARIISEMDQVLRRLKADQLSTSRDYDDQVFFDLAETRIGLAYSDLTLGPVTSCLTVSVGPLPGVTVTSEDPGYDVLCSRIVERLQSRFMPVGVLWHQTTESISADLIDALTDSLPPADKILPPIDSLLDPLWETAAANEAAQGSTRVIGRFPEAPQREPISPVTAMNETTAARERPVAAIRLMPRKPSAVANDAPAAIAPRSAELARLRDALYPENPIEVGLQDNQPMTAQMRLAVHAMNATLIMVWMPMGVAVMTYSILKGEDMRLSGRLMALTGTLLAFAHSPFGQSVAAAVAGTMI